MGKNKAIESLLRKVGRDTAFDVAHPALDHMRARARSASASDWVIPNTSQPGTLDWTTRALSPAPQPISRIRRQVESIWSMTSGFPSIPIHPLRERQAALLSTASLSRGVHFALWLVPDHIESILHSTTTNRRRNRPLIRLCTSFSPNAKYENTDRTDTTHTAIPTVVGSDHCMLW